jgi:peptidoglycan/LPS O-acetylase OafA/YrhL
VYNAYLDSAGALYTDPFYVKSTELSTGLGWLLGFIDRWHMPLLFLLAGASTFLALRNRGVGTYLAERSKRLLIPFAIGLFLIVPPQTYVGATFNSGYKPSFWHYMISGDFLAWNIRDGGDYYGGFGIGHLWFVLWLFLVSLLALPLVAWMRGERGRAWAVRWAQRLSRPVWWLLPPLLIWLGDGLPDLAGKNPFYYLVFFVLGLVTIADPSFRKRAEAWRWSAVATGAALTIAYTATGGWRDPLPDPSLARFASDYSGFLGTWLLIVGMIGLGSRYLDRPSPALSYLAEASYPLYILHQTVIVVIAAAIVTLPLVWPLQWAVLLAGSVAVTFALYEGARRFGPTRFALGMKKRAS